MINPKDADTKIFQLKPEQQKEIKEKLGSEAKMPASFKQIYQQFKDVKIQTSEESSSLKLSAEDFACIETYNTKALATDNKHQWKAVIEVKDGKNVTPKELDPSDIDDKVKSNKFDNPQLLKSIIGPALKLITDKGYWGLTATHTILTEKRKGKGYPSNRTYVSLSYIGLSPEGSFNYKDRKNYKWDGSKFVESKY